MMDSLRKEVRDLISVNERLQSALAQGERLTDDEAGVIRMCANELLEKAAASQSGAWHESGDGHVLQTPNMFPLRSDR